MPFQENLPGDGVRGVDVSAMCVHTQVSNVLLERALTRDR